MDEQKRDNIYSIWSGFMPELREKVKKIQKKCAKFGCDFIFEEIGEEIRVVEDKTDFDPETGKHPTYNLKFIIVHAEGTAVINGWQFVASVEHTEKGNIFSKALTDVEIPERYRCSDPYCEHCNSNRMRKGTFIVRNIESGEFKQVGHNCLMDYTHGMSASCASYFASLKEIFSEEEEKCPSGYGYREKYYDPREILLYTAETIRHFGFSKAENRGNSTRDVMTEFFDVDHGNTRYWEQEYIDSVREKMKSVGFDHDSDEANKMVDDALEWIGKQEATNDYMHNLKVVCSLDYATYDKFGLLVSLFPTFNRDLEIQEQRKLEAEQGKMSEHVGNIGDKVNVDVESVKCITSWTNSWDGYHEQTTYLWKIVGKDGNIFVWKTNKCMNEDKPPKSIKGTVKEHKVFREVKQTELTRCRIA